MFLRRTQEHLELCRLYQKVCNVRMVPLAIDIVTSELTGRKSPVPELKEQDIPYYGVKRSCISI